MRLCEREKTQDLLEFFWNKIMEKTLLCGFSSTGVCRTSTPRTYRAFNMAFQLKLFQYFTNSSICKQPILMFRWLCTRFYIYILGKWCLLANYFQGIKNWKLKTSCWSYLMKIDIRQIWCFYYYWLQCLRIRACGRSDFMNSKNIE